MVTLQVEVVGAVAQLLGEDFDALLPDHLYRPGGCVGGGWVGGCVGVWVCAYIILTLPYYSLAYS